MHINIKKLPRKAKRAPILYISIDASSNCILHMHTIVLQLIKVYAVLNAVWCCLNLGNFIVFLYNGTFLHVYERLCAMRTVHPKGRQLREVYQILAVVL